MVDSWNFVNLKHEQDKFVDIYNALLRTALETRENASPVSSGFKVGSALFLGEDYDLVGGCNIEYGIDFNEKSSKDNKKTKKEEKERDNTEEKRAEDTRSLHAEESTVSNAITKYGNDILIKVSATLGETPGIVTSCGNCLDILKRYSNEDTLLIGANTEGYAEIFTFEDVFPTIFQKINRNKLPSGHKGLLEKALMSKSYSSDIFSEEMEETGAAVMTEKGAIYEGVREGNAAYHPITAIDAAIVHARAHGDPFITAIAYVSRNGYIHGKDRQRIFEKGDELNEPDLPVLIWDGKSDTIHRTTASALLPHSFGARTMGLEETVQQSLEKYDRY